MKSSSLSFRTELHIAICPGLSTISSFSTKVHCILYIPAYVFEDRREISKLTTNELNCKYFSKNLRFYSC